MNSPLQKARSAPESLKGRILEAARHMFARQGFHGTSTRAIAGEVGIDVSTLYYHWGSKQDLFDGVLENIKIDFEERIRRWVHGTKDLPLGASFDLAVDVFSPFFMNRDVVRVVMFSFFDEEFGGARGWAIRSQRQIIDTLRTFMEKRCGIAALPDEFDTAVLALIASTLALVGSRNHLGTILAVDPESEEYRQLVFRSLRRLISAFLASVAPAEQRAWTQLARK